jgi:hypothetical protein
MLVTLAVEKFHPFAQLEKYFSELRRSFLVVQLHGDRLGVFLSGQAAIIPGCSVCNCRLAILPGTVFPRAVSLGHRFPRNGPRWARL